MTGIIEARNELYALADRLYTMSPSSFNGRDVGRELMAIVNTNMYRRSPVTKAPRRSSSVTDRKLQEIRSYHAINPTATYMSIGQIYDVSIGRVSEAIAGKRE